MTLRASVSVDYTFASAALTTIFTMPTDCFSRPLTLISTASYDTLTNGFSPDELMWDAYQYGCDYPKTCYPKESHREQCDSPIDNTMTLYDLYNFSPGVCPDDYTMFNVSATRNGTVTTTSASCCPTGYTANYVGAWCSSAFTSSTAVLTTDPIYTGTGTDSLDPSEYTYSLKGTTTLGPGSFHVIWREILTVSWQSSDLPIFTPASAPLLQMNAAGIISSSSSTTPSTASSTWNGSSPGRKKHLTQREWIGVEIAAAAGLILVIVLVIWCLLRKRLVRKGTLIERHQD